MTLLLSSCGIPAKIIIEYYRTPKKELMDKVEELHREDIWATYIDRLDINIEVHKDTLCENTTHRRCQDVIIFGQVVPANGFVTIHCSKYFEARGQLKNGLMLGRWEFENKRKGFWCADEVYCTKLGIGGYGNGPFPEKKTVLLPYRPKPHYLTLREYHTAIQGYKLRNKVHKELLKAVLETPCSR